MYRDDANGIKLKEIVIIIKNTIITSFLFFISPQASGNATITQRVSVSESEREN